MQGKIISKKIEAQMKKFSEIKSMLRGSVNKINVRCGNKNCKCAKGIKHQAYILTYKGENNVTKTVYVQKNRLKQVKTMIKNYKMAKKIFNKILDLNVELLKARK